MLTRHARLIKPLCVLLETHHLSEAADTLALSKSAASKILKKARELFNDELLERRGNGMYLTPLAEQLLPRLQLLCTVAADCLPQEQAQAQGVQSLSLQMPSGMLHALGEEIMARVRARWPGIRLTLGSLTENYRQQLLAGTLDFAIDHGCDGTGLFQELSFVAGAVGLFLPRILAGGGQGKNSPVIMTAIAPPGKNACQMAAEFLKKVGTLPPVVFQTDNAALLFHQAQTQQAGVYSSSYLILDPWIQAHFELSDASGLSMKPLLDAIDYALVFNRDCTGSDWHRQVAELLSALFQEKALMIAEKYRPRVYELDWPLD